MFDVGPRLNSFSGDNEDEDVFVAVMGVTGVGKVPSSKQATLHHLVC